MPGSAWFFISDLHLSDHTPATLNAFECFFVSVAQEGNTIVVLGDLFETWVGDDDQSECISRVKTTFESARDCGATVYLMHGNRDFLIGQEFADETGIEVLPDPYVVNIHGMDVLLTHGDALCTDDTAYQAFRTQSRHEAWQENFLKLPLQTRHQMAQGLRHQSEEAKKVKAMDIMDVNPSAVAEVFAGHWPDGTYIAPVPTMIHGHTHRPQTHEYPTAFKGQPAKRVVLSDWDFEHSPARGNYLRIDASGWTTHSLGKQ